MFENCKLLKSLDLKNFNTPLLNDAWRMFYGCESLEFLDVSNLNTDLVTNMENMFFGCSKLSSLNLSNFNTLSVTNMAYMFQNCKSLKYLDLKNFNTPKVTTMGYMFAGCELLEYLNIDNLNTSLVTYLDNMFNGCQKLTTLNVSNFDISSAVGINHMFYDCKSLKSLDLNNFDTSKINSLEKMFYGCNSLEYLEISHFDTNKVNNMDGLFNGCSSLTSLNISNFNISLNSIVDNMFSNCNENLIICLNQEEISEYLQTQLNPYTNNCTYMCVENSHKKYNYEQKKCIDSCNSDETYKFEFNNICYSSCPNGTHNSTNKEYQCEKDSEVEYTYFSEIFSTQLDQSESSLVDTTTPSSENNENIICDIKCKECTLESKANNLCTLCNINQKYYPKFNDNTNRNNFINCYNQVPGGYYLDNNKNIYMPCFSECKNCNEVEEENRNMCNNCYSNYLLNYLYCFEICNYNYDKCYMKDRNNENSPNHNSIKNKNVSFYSYELNPNLNEINDIYKNSTFISFSEETYNFLVEQFNLNKQNDKIFVLIIDYPGTNMQSITNDYEYKFFLNNGSELNKDNINKDFYTDIYVPIKDKNLANFNYSKIFAEKGYDIYDKNSDFYNDICTPAYLGENDITISDRKKDIYPNNITFCKENCYYNGVNLEEERIICKCNLNNNNNLTEENDESGFFLKKTMVILLVTY